MQYTTGHRIIQLLSVQLHTLVVLSILALALLGAHAGTGTAVLCPYSGRLNHLSTPVATRCVTRGVSPTCRRVWYPIRPIGQRCICWRCRCMPGATAPIGVRGQRWGAA